MITREPSSQPAATIASRTKGKMEGRTVSHYLIRDRLGGGGMGVVYAAEDLRLKRLVALKFLPRELTQDHEARQRFVQEAQAASSLDRSAHRHHLRDR